MDTINQEELDSLYYKFFMLKQEACQSKETSEDELVAQGERRAYGKILAVLADLQ